jgi:mannan endo-1,4-beta-mannosidase
MRRVPLTVIGFATAILLASASVVLTTRRVSVHTVSPVNSNANTATRNVLNWLTHLPNGSSNRIASGFFGGYSNHGFGTGQVEELRTATNQYPAIFSCDYGAGWATASNPTTLIDFSCNSTLTSWWNSGGLVTISVHSPSPANANGGGLRTPMINFADLLNPRTAAGARWRSLLDQMAQGLQQLENAGVTVLWRPFHEMNGDWFWWGNRDENTFRQVWQQTFNYLTTTKGLDNLLWVYSVDSGRDNRTLFYPGNQYVDIVGVDAYDDNPQSSGIQSAYNELTGLGKPFAFSEIGPDTQGSFDYTQWNSAWQQNYLRTTYFLTWNDGWGPGRNQNASVFMNNPWIVNRGEVHFSQITEPGGSSLLYGFESSTDSWTGSNVAGGPWRVNEWASQGSWSLKADVNLAGASQIRLARVAPYDLSNRSALRATVRVAPWGNHAGGTVAKLYVKTGPRWHWYDSGNTRITANGTTLTLNLSSIPNRNNVREIGIQYLPASESSGRSAVYVDNVTAR